MKKKTLVSCSNDYSIIFYLKDNNRFKKNNQISTNGTCSSIIQTKDKMKYFYVISERKIKETMTNNSKYEGFIAWFIMMKKDLLLIPGKNQSSIINTNEY